MAKYIKQEVPDMRKTGEQKVFYRLKVERNVDFEEFIQTLCSYHRGISRGEALRVLVSASDVLAELLGEGYSVTLDDWGTFKATIGLEEDKKMDTIDGDESKRKCPQPPSGRSELPSGQEAGAKRQKSLQAGA